LKLISSIIHQSCYFISHEEPHMPPILVFSYLSPIGAL